MEELEQNFEIEITPEVAMGVFSNLILINHSSTEFVLDVAQILPGMPKAVVRSRVILTPEHAKRLLHALQPILINLNPIMVNCRPIMTKHS